MDCRTLQVLALGLLTATGCTYPVGALRNDNCTESQKPAEDGSHKASTWVAYGDYRATAGFSPEQKPPQQKQLREEAKMAYLKAIEVDPKYIPAYLALARLQQLCEDNAGAQGVYEQALKVAPKDARLWFELGMCQCRVKNWNTAVEGFGKASELDSGNRQYSTTLGFALARAGRYEESFAALARHNGEAKAHYDLARMLLHLNHPELARQQAAMALQQDSSMSAARTLVADLDTRITLPKAEIQSVSHSVPAPRDNSSQPAGGSLRMPPLPIISVTAKED